MSNAQTNDTQLAALSSKVARLAGRLNVYDAGKSDHILSISAALDRLDAVKDYVEDTEPDDWQVAYERIVQIIDGRSETNA